MEEVSATDIKTVKTQTPSQKSINEEDNPQKDPVILEDPKSRQDPTSQRSKEELITIQTYTSPDSTANKDFQSSITENNESIDQIIANGTETDSDPLYDQKSLSYISSPSNGECRPQDNHNKCVEDIGLETVNSRLSEISLDSELSSELSEELLDNDTLLTKKKKRDLKKTESVEDPEEEFRRHFLKTFQDLPRLSQISLDDKPNKITPKESTEKTETNAEEEIPETSNKKIEKSKENIDSPDKT
ncbi:uncharacterized protein LOC119547026 [Drosophila subpulchrella]|uniref:uncharacterized protein LOC119547026 n=1 Tax=Drosophila subpulchrella TaxID=1486046 RepID=UPI0018A1B547|nr:uncharacterized protein LOC119547026 [Drosophila subpulchrella]